MREQVVVVGASGFGRETLDTLGAMIAVGSQISITGVIDDLPSEANLARIEARGVEHLGTLDDWLASGQDAKFLLAIGAPAIRRKLVDKLEAAGRHPFTAVHPTAILGARTVLEAGAIVSAGAILSTNVHLGRHVHVNPGVVIGHDSVAEDFVSINPAAVISGEVHLESGVLVGAAATVLQHLRVASSSTVGAGAVVTKNVPPNVVVKGVPGAWG